MKNISKAQRNKAITESLLKRNELNFHLVRCLRGHKFSLWSAWHKGTSHKHNFRAVIQVVDMAAPVWKWGLHRAQKCRTLKNQACKKETCRCAANGGCDVWEVVSQSSKINKWSFCPYWHSRSRWNFFYFLPTTNVISLPQWKTKRTTVNVGNV